MALTTSRSSPPGPVADEIHLVTPHLLHWSAFDPSIKTELSSSAFVFNGGLALIDPIWLGEAAMAELLRHGEPRAVLATNGNHARAAGAYRDRFKVPVLCNPEACRDLETKANAVVEPDDEIFGLRPVYLKGAGPGETAYQGVGGHLIIGDAVIHAGSTGLALLPDKYCLDPAANRESVRQLAQLEFRVLAFAHGAPVTSQAKTKLQALADS